MKCNSCNEESKHKIKVKGTIKEFCRKHAERYYFRLYLFGEEPEVKDNKNTGNNSGEKPRLGTRKHKRKRSKNKKTTKSIK